MAQFSRAMRRDTAPELPPPRMLAQKRPSDKSMHGVKLTRDAEGWI
jgi:hypothetical protein